MKGNVLLLSLLITSGILMTGMALTTIIINEIRSARNLDNGTLAFYAAESGIEEALYQLRQVAPSPTFSSLNKIAPVVLSNGASWIREADNKSKVGSASVVVRYDYMAVNDVKTYDLFNPDYDSGNNPGMDLAAGVFSLKITAADDNPANGIDPQIELTWYQWNGDTNNPQLGLPNTTLYSCGGGCNITKSGLSESSAYRFTIKVLGDNIRNVVLRGYNSSNTEIPIVLDPQLIKAKGNFSRSGQILEVGVPRRDTEKPGW